MKAEINESETFVQICATNLRLYTGDREDDERIEDAIKKFAPNRLIKKTVLRVHIEKFPDNDTHTEPYGHHAPLTGLNPPGSVGE